MAPIGADESIKVVLASVKVMSDIQIIIVNTIKKPNNFKNDIRKDNTQFIVGNWELWKEY